MQPRVSSPTVPSAVFELLLSKTRSVAAPSSMPLRMRRATSGAGAHRSAGVGKRGRGRAGPPQARLPPPAEGPPAQEKPCTTRPRSAHVRRWSAPEHGRAETRAHTHGHIRTQKGTGRRTQTHVRGRARIVSVHRTYTTTLEDAFSNTGDRRTPHAVERSIAPGTLGQLERPQTREEMQN